MRAAIACSLALTLFCPPVQAHPGAHGKPAVKSAAVSISGPGLRPVTAGQGGPGLRPPVAAPEPSRFCMQNKSGKVHCIPFGPH